MIRVFSFAIVGLFLVRTAVAQCENSYRDLLETLASPVCFSAEFAQDRHDDPIVMVRLEIARQRLLTMSELPADL